MQHDNLITLERMDEDYFEIFNQQLIIEYAAEKVKAGIWTEAEALEKSKASNAHLLPDGVHTKNHYLFCIRNAAQQNVGHIWLGRMTETLAWVYDISIHEAYRNKGYAAAAFAAVETFAKELGYLKIGLNVFGHNTAARKLYEKLDYTTDSMQMSKLL
jgi:RimJ/RimL family protein N-acetyltransferase